MGCERKHTRARSVLYREWHHWSVFCAGCRFVHVCDCGHHVYWTHLYKHRKGHESGVEEYWIYFTSHMELSGCDKYCCLLLGWLRTNR